MNHIPQGYHTITPYLRIKDAAKAMEFYKEIFAAQEIGRLIMPDGKIGHAEIVIGDSRVMLSDEFPEWQGLSPETLKGTPVGFCIYTENPDAMIEKAVAAGAKIAMPIADQFYGDRSGKIIDPFGHEWTIAKHLEDVSFAEMQKRMEKM